MPSIVETMVDVKIRSQFVMASKGSTIISLLDSVIDSRRIPAVVPIDSDGTTYPFLIFNDIQEILSAN
jgi:hypothetical protein